MERPALKPLPAEPYVFAEWKECRVGLDVETEKHYYSMSHQLPREKVWARIPARHNRSLPLRQAQLDHKMALSTSILGSSGDPPEQRSLQLRKPHLSPFRSLEPQNRLHPGIFPAQLGFLQAAL